MTNMLPIIMPVRNRINLTRQTVETLERTITVPYRLILVDDGSDDGTREYVKSLENKHTVILNDTPMGPGHTRNIGMAAAGKADFYYHTDCDMYFLPGWNQKLQLALDLFPELGLVGGRHHPHHGQAGLLVKENIVSVRVSDQQVGMSMFFRREAWEKAGPFKQNAPDEHAMGQEDTAFCNRIREAGYQVGAISPAVVLHCGIKNSFGKDTAGHPDELRQPFPPDCII